MTRNRFWLGCSYTGVNGLFETVLFFVEIRHSEKTNVGDDNLAMTIDNHDDDDSTGNTNSNINTNITSSKNDVKIVAVACPVAYLLRTERQTDMRRFVLRLLHTLTRTYL